MRIYIFVKLSCQRSTNTLSVGIKYSMRDRMCDIDYCALPATLRYGLYSVIDVSTPFLHQLP